MDFKQRIEALAEAQGLDLKRLCAACGIAYTTMQNYTLRGRQPNADTLLRLHTHTGVDVIWLLTGEGEMYRRAGDGTAAPVPAVEEFAALLDKLTPEQQRALLESVKEKVLLNELRAKLEKE